MEPIVLLHVKHGAAIHDLHVSLSCTTQQLQVQVEASTGVFSRLQKLIHKGKVLEGAKRLSDQGVKEGATIMLLGSQGPTATKGQQAASSASQLKAAEARARIEASYAAARGGSSMPAAVPAASAAGSKGGEGVLVTHLLERQRAWRATGVITLRDLGLAALPYRLLTPFQPLTHASQPPATGAAAPPSGTPATQDHSTPSSAADPSSASDLHVDPAELEAWRAWAGSTRSVDLCRNKLTSLPAALSALTSLASLRASHNPLEDAGCPWPALAALTGLTLLALDHTCLTRVPEGVLVRWGALRMMSLAGCRLTGCLHTDVGAMLSLEVLDLSSNRLEGLPEEIGACSRLMELNAADNAITAIPTSLRTCTALQSLRLDKNRIGSVPSGLLKGCVSLWLLSLTGNPISLDQLRSTEGYSDLDDRRRLRADKQIESSVMLHGSNAFSEGADVQQWGHWQLNK